MGRTAWLFVLLLIVAGGAMLHRNRGAFAPASTRRISQEGVDAIKRHEGWSAVVYLDVAGKRTIGYGHLIRAGEEFPGPITREQGEAILRADLETAEAAVRRHVSIPVTQGMYDALVSFTFNLGGGNLSSSTLLRKLNAGDYTGAAAEFLRWNKAGGREVGGLTTRRQDEKNNFLRGIA